MRVKCTYRQLSFLSGPQRRSQLVKSPNYQLELFFKPPKRTDRNLAANSAQILLSRFLLQTPLDSRSKMGAIPANIIGPEVNNTHPLQVHDLQVQLLSFLIRAKNERLATRVYSTLLHRGTQFSLGALRYLCQDALCLRGSRLIDLLVESLSSSADAGLEGVVNGLIIDLFLYGKYAAVLKLGVLSFPENGFRLGAIQLRRILQSIFTLHRGYNHSNSQSKLHQTEELIEAFDAWIQVRSRNPDTLDQYDIAVLLQGLSSLLWQHSKDGSLSRSMRNQILGMITSISTHAQHPISKIVMAEVYLDDRDVAERRMHRARWDEPLLPTPIYQSLMHDIEEMHTTFSNGDGMSSSLMKARVAKIMGRSFSRLGSIIDATLYLQSIIDCQRWLVAKALVSGESEFQILKKEKYIAELELRFNSALIRLCSRYLWRQQLPELFYLLPFTRHLRSLTTFTRLWKRVVGVSIRRGGWDGPTGLKAVVEQMEKWTPTCWSPSLIGKSIFASPIVIENTIRVALGCSLPDWHSLAQHKCRRTVMTRVIQRDVAKFQDWKATVLPFIELIDFPWRDVLFLPQNVPQQQQQYADNKVDISEYDVREEQGKSLPKALAYGPKLKV